MRINTTQQKVDKEKYGSNYDRIFRSNEEYTGPAPKVIAGKDLLDDPVDPMDKDSNVIGTIVLGVFCGVVVGGFIAGLLWLGLV